MKRFHLTYESVEHWRVQATVEAETLEEAKERARKGDFTRFDELYLGESTNLDFEAKELIGPFTLASMTIKEVVE